MQGTGKIYEVSGENTEWEDILVNKQILSQEEVLRNKGLDPSKYMHKEEAVHEEKQHSLEEQLQYSTLDDIDKLLEDDTEDHNIVERYRADRLAALKLQQVRNRFGDVREISKDEWVREVTEASHACHVAVFLYQDSKVECRVLEEKLTIIAAKFKYVKFVRIRATQAVENWPEANLPTLFVYRDGALQQQFITLKTLGGTSMTADDLEWWLYRRGIVESELEEDPAETRMTSSKASSGGVKGLRAKYGRNGGEDDDDEDD